MAESNIKITKSYPNAEKENEGERRMYAHVHTYRHSHIVV